MKRGWLEELRKRDSMSQAEAAKRVGVSRSYYTQIEAGEKQKRLDAALMWKFSDVFHEPFPSIALKEYSWETTEAV